MKLMKTLLAAAVVAASVPAMAYEAGDMMVKAGAINVNPKSDNIDLTGLNLGQAQISDDTQLGLTFTYMVTPKVGVEVLAATPFEHEVKAGGNEIASTKHLPPTVSAQYYFMDAASKVQPYVGVGLNYTNFFDADGAAGDLKDSWGVAFSAGVNYDLDEKWLINAAVWKIDIDSEIEDSPIAAANGAEVEIDPIVVMIGGGYKF